MARMQVDGDMIRKMAIYVTEYPRSQGLTWSLSIHALRTSVCVWRNTIKIIQKLQNRAARFTANMTNDVDQTVVLHAYWAGKKGKNEVQSFKLIGS